MIAEEQRDKFLDDLVCRCSRAPLSLESIVWLVPAMAQRHVDGGGDGVGEFDDIIVELVRRLLPTVRARASKMSVADKREPLLWVQIDDDVFPGDDLPTGETVYAVFVGLDGVRLGRVRPRARMDGKPLIESEGSE